MFFIILTFGSGGQAKPISLRPDSHDTPTTVGSSSQARLNSPMSGVHATPKTVGSGGHATPTTVESIGQVRSNSIGSGMAVRPNTFWHKRQQKQCLHDVIVLSTVQTFYIYNVVHKVLSLFPQYLYSVLDLEAMSDPRRLGLVTKLDPSLLGLAAEPDLTTFGIKIAKTTPSRYYSVIHSANTLYLQYSPQCNESMFIVPAQCFSHAF